MTLDAPVSSKSKNKDTKYLLRSGLAGGVAGCVAKTVVAPLDRVKILFQTSNPDFQKYAGTWSGAYRAGVEIYRFHGVRGLLQGHSATLLRIFPYAAIKYMFYDQIHHTLMPTREHETNLRRFAAGSLSGTLSICVTYPLELIRVRLAYVTRSPETSGVLNRSSASNNVITPNSHHSQSVSPRRTLRDAVSDIYHESSRFKPSMPFLTELRTSFSPSTTNDARSLVSPARTIRAHLFYYFPVFSFYRGFTVSLMGMIPYAGTSFLTWGYLRALLIPESSHKGSRPTPVMDLAIGAVAGSVSQTVSYPFEIIRRRMQVGGITNGDPRSWLTFGETVRKIYAARGWGGFYIGLSIGYAKVIPLTATSFAVWQWGKRLLDI